MRRLFTRLIIFITLAVVALSTFQVDQAGRLIIALIIGVPSFFLMIMSRMHLGKSFSIMPEAKALVTTGLYSRIQHPMYLFLDLFLVALIVAIGWPWLLVLWGVLIIMQTVQGQREQRVLASAFGTEYNSYRKRLWI